MTQNQLNEDSKRIVELVSKHIDLKAFPYGKTESGIVEVVKRESMYGGDGVVYMISTLDARELVNNRFAQYMVLPNKGDEAGFHDHGSKKEQELYIIVHGEGKYLERVGADNIVRTEIMKKGNMSSIQGDDNFHSIINTSDEPLIIFVITTNQR